MARFDAPRARFSMSRRAFLATTAAGLAGAAIAGAPAAPRPRLLQMNGYPVDAETPLELLGRSYLTPNDLFYVRHHWNPTMPDPATWALKVDGEVEKPLSLTLSDLK